MVDEGVISSDLGAAEVNCVDFCKCLALLFKFRRTHKLKWQG